MKQDDFWSDRATSESIINESNDLKKDIETLEELENKINEIKENKEDQELLTLLDDEFKELNEVLNKFEIKVLLSGKYDKNNAIIEINSGAGGTESQDWALMLYRMYVRYFEKKRYKVEIINYREGEEVGLKSASLLVSGKYVYGHLKSEKGVHRLVRLSPFDSNNKRHTSFASIEITPEIDNTINIEIEDKDLRIDVYRSSGAGGQSVNTTDSAVRITHIPTNTVVTCQNERSQIQNKETALKVLRSKLYKLEIEKQEVKMNELKGEQKGIEFGSQIRSYVMHPYNMVKDHRLNIETSNVKRVLDGDIDMFIEEYLKRGF